MRGAGEDIEIVTLLLSSLALALDDMEGEFDHMEGEFDVGKDRLAFLFHQFGSNLRKLQVGPSGDLMEMQQMWKFYHPSTTGVAYGETVVSNIVAVLINIHEKETTSHLEKLLLDGYKNGCQEGIVIKYSMD